MRLRSEWSLNVERRFWPKCQKRVNDFFYFYPIFYFYPWLNSPAALSAKASEGAPFS